ncbi:hypothetical protein C357_17398 [Citreicella sp. 357]|nr:hypothetical protein C357_17398 [Citreicella sp. 357]
MRADLADPLTGMVATRILTGGAAAIFSPRRHAYGQVARRFARSAGARP